MWVPDVRWLFRCSFVFSPIIGKQKGHFPREKHCQPKGVPKLMQKKQVLTVAYRSKTLLQEKVDKF